MSARIRRNRERHAAANAARRAGTVGTNPARRTPTAAGAVEYVGRKGKRPGRDKGQGEWRISPYYRNAVTIDARWSA